MDRDQQKIEQIKSLDPNDRSVSPQRRRVPVRAGRRREGPAGQRRESGRVVTARETRDLDGFVPTEPVQQDGEYIATKREGTHQLHCIASRDHGRWRRLSDWSDQMPESATPHAEILFAPEPGRLHPGQPWI